MIGLGTIVNCAAIMLGSLIGLTIGKRFTQRYQNALLKGMGLTVSVIGIQMSLKGDNLLILGCSMALGAIIGEYLDLEDGLRQFSEKLKQKFAASKDNFTEGFVGATLLYCVGSMAILGSIEEGIKGEHSILFVKAVLDGLVAIALASTFGIGVFFSGISVLLYQGLLTFIASMVGNIASDAIINHMTAVGGLLILGLGLNMLEITKIKVANLLPALVLSVLLPVLITYFSK